MKYLIYPACFYPSDGGSYTVTIPDLPGAITEGDSLEEAFEMAIDCASGWIFTAIQNGEQIPIPSHINEIELDTNNGFTSLIQVNLLSMKEKNKKVRKTIQIHEFLVKRALELNINFSKTLEEALLEKIYK